MVAENENLFSFPDTAKHQVNCDAFTDEELKEASLAVWPTKNGVADIAYTVSPKIPYWMQPFLKASELFSKRDPQPLAPNSDQEYQNQVKETIRAALDKCSEASKGRIKFHEGNVGLHSPGISFYFADDKALEEEGVAGFTQWKLDNNGDLNQAAVVLPRDPAFWNFAEKDDWTRADDFNTVVHELLHALGGMHFHEFPKMKEKLENMENGVYCSVLPYLQKIRTEQNSCHENCNPPFAANPGPLDERFLKVNYENKSCNCDGIYSKALKVKNLHSFIESSIISGVHTGLSVYASNLSLKPNEQLLSKTKAQLIADGASLAALIYLDFPLSTTAAFTLSAATKYLPDKFVNQLPKGLGTLLTSNYSAFALNLALGLYEGKCLYPLVTTMVTKVAGSIMGYTFGTLIGAFNAFLTNKLFQSIYAHWPAEIEQIKNASIALPCNAGDVNYASELAEIVVDDLKNTLSNENFPAKKNQPIYFSSIHTFFNKHLKQLQSYTENLHQQASYKSKNKFTMALD